MENKYLKKRLIIGGLLPTLKEEQKFSFGAIFNYVPPELLPDEWDAGVEPLKIKNQGASFICVAEGTTSAREPKEGIELAEEFTIKTISEILGNTNWIYSGTSLDIGAKASLKGFLSRSEAPYSVLNDGVGIVASPDKWAATYSDLALKHQTKNWFWVGSSGGKMFDKIRGAIFSLKDKVAKEELLCISGVVWNNEWTDQTYIDTEGTPAGGHCIVILPKWLNKKESFYDKGVLKKWGRYLKIQNSIGNIGENGCQYFHESLINRLFIFKAIMFQDAPDMTKEKILAKSKYYRASFIKKIFLLLVNFIKSL